MISEIKIFSCRTAPSKHLLCDGAAYQPSDYPDLFNMIGYDYSPVGTVSGPFNVPDTQGRAIVGAGGGIGLTPRARGEQYGEEGVTLTLSQAPIMQGVAGTTNAAPGAVPVAVAGLIGGSQPHENQGPRMAFIVCIQAEE